METKTNLAGPLRVLAATTLHFIVLFVVVVGVCCDWLMAAGPGAVYTPLPA